MRLLALAALSIFVILSNSCAGSSPTPAAAAEYRATATVKELMGSVVNPNAEFVWKSVESTSGDTAKEKAPSTDAEWADLRRHAVALREATDLLVIPGRKMAGANVKPKDASELTPEAMQALLDKDRAKWVAFSHGLHATVEEVIKAVDAKSVSGVLDAGGAIDGACESCHQVFWYPDQKAPDQKK
jgi:cytochrome c556